MVQNMRDNTLKEKSMVKAPSRLLMVAYIKESFSITKYQGKVYIYGLMVKNMKANGKKTKCMGMVYSFGKMVKNMKGTL